MVIYHTLLLLCWQVPLCTGRLNLIGGFFSEVKVICFQSLPRILGILPKSIQGYVIVSLNYWVSDVPFLFLNDKLNLIVAIVIIYLGNSMCVWSFNNRFKWFYLTHWAVFGCVFVALLHRNHFCWISCFAHTSSSKSIFHTIVFLAGMSVGHGGLRWVPPQLAEMMTS